MQARSIFSANGRIGPGARRMQSRKLRRLAVRSCTQCDGDEQQSVQFAPHRLPIQEFGASGE
jgi:hypothetical protein